MNDLLFEALEKAIVARADSQLWDINNPLFMFPAQNEAVGNLVLTVENNEITVEVGRIYHRHSLPATSASVQQNVAIIVEETLYFVNQLFENELIMYVGLDNEKVLTSGSFHLSHLPNFKIESTISYHFYHWSGHIFSTKQNTR
ncbi:MAG: hypothetical protein HC912_00275 [Saprospiraceae bacterium]|nr:hypothetical protein [Saprospiraceae bacterium]